MNDKTRYPLLQKALAEQAAIFALGMDGTEELAKATRRALELIDAHVQAPAAEKDAILTVCVLMHCPPYLALKSNRFAAAYNDQVQAMIDRHVNGPGVTAADTDLVQIYSAMFVAHAENLQRHILATAAPTRSWLQDMRDGLEDYTLDRRVFADGIAPGLRAIEDAEIAATFGVIDQAIATLAAKPAPKKPRGPKR